MSLKKKLGMGVASMALGAALIGGGTFAYFNDTESSTGNTFAAGTIDLKPELTGSALWNLGNQQPGATFDTGTQTLSNAGTLAGDLTVEFSVADTDAGLNGTGALSEVVEITGLYIDGVESLASFALDADGSGAVELDELHGEKLDLGDLAADGQVGDSVTLRVTGEFPDSGSPQNQYQGDSVAVDFTFELKQQ